MSSARIGVTFAKPRFFLGDVRLTVALDGEPLHAGSFLEGFTAARDVAPGAHELTTSIGTGGVLARRRSYSITVGDGDEVTAVLEYSRFWGNFTSKLGVVAGSAPPTAAGGAAPPPVSPAIELAAFQAFFRQLTPRLVVTPLLVVANLAVFGAMVARGVSPVAPTIQNLLDWGADYGPRVAGGEVWRLASNLFVHIGLLHLAFNMIVLADAGRRIEAMFGNVPFLALYLASGLAGSVTSLAVHPELVSAGASGAIFGLYGGLGAMLLRQRDTIPPGVLLRLRNGAIVFVLFNVVYGASRKGIDVAAHIGGLGGGFVAGLALARPLTPGTKPRAGAALATLVAAIVVAAGAVAALPKRADFPAEIDAFAAAETRALDALNRAVRASQEGAIDDDHFAAVVERDVLPPWRAARTRLAGLQGLGAAELSRRDLLVEYMTAREEGWTLLDEGLRRRDPELVERGTARQKDAAQVLERLKELNRSGT